ncbi:MAG: DoxX family protein [Moraxellaceae bacterium]|jgi:putative oxidoreductase|nr:DoxX family protein [Moraxellaceae bacterium]
MEFFRQLNDRVAGIVAAPAVNSALILAARALMASIFLISGYEKIGNYEATQGYMQFMGVPGGLLPLVILLELGGGLALLAGFQTRLAALALAVFTLVAAFLFHRSPEDMQRIMFLKNLAMTGGLLAFTVFGGGRLSVDGEGDWRP